MVSQTALAAINLHSILRNMEDLCDLDERAKQLIQNHKKAIRFCVPQMPPLTLSFENGKCKASDEAGAHCDIRLKFTSPTHFNQMVSGEKNPIPTKGFTSLGFLKKEFMALSQILETYLKPTEEGLKDRIFAEKSTILTAYTAFFALSQIGNYDELGKLSAGRIEDGAICIDVTQGPAVTIRVKEGHMHTEKGFCKEAKAFMNFADIQVAEGILRGTLDSYACIGKGLLSVKGKIPMIDNLNKILSLVPVYLA